MSDRRLQALQDDAELYCPHAVKYIARQDWQLATAALLDRCKKLDMALQSMTPGGSEYVGNPDLCVEFIYDQITKGREARKELNRVRNT